jgi:hypothetical protein
MKKIVIFGCSYYGRAAFRVLKRKRKKILCWVDNDKEKINKKLFNKIIKPIEYLKQVEFDKIIFCGRYIEEMLDQYNHLNLDRKKISIWNIFQCKPSGEQKKKREIYSIKILKKIINILNYNNIEYWTDYSGLLQVVRDKKISLLSDFELSFFQKDLNKIQTLFSSNYLYNVSKKKIRGGYFKIIVSGKNKSINYEPPIFDFHFKKKVSSFYYDSDMKIKKISTKFLKNFMLYKFNKNINLRVPLNYNSYLKYLYGKDVLIKRVPFYKDQNR